DGGVRAAAGLDGGDALLVEDARPAQEVGVLGGVDVVGDHAELERRAEGPAERGHQGRLAAADGAAHAEPERSAAAVGGAVVVVMPGAHVAPLHETKSLT